MMMILARAAKLPELPTRGPAWLAGHVTSLRASGAGKELAGRVRGGMDLDLWTGRHDTQDGGPAGRVAEEAAGPAPARASRDVWRAATTASRMETRINGLVSR